jgi:predicted MFS family arabinose efflux permease
MYATGMTEQSKPLAPAAVAMIGLFALASAMGIGRFSLTPILPLMQRDAGLTMAQGGWLACANYLGYLAGALICIALTPRPAAATRWGLAAIGLFTLSMGVTESEIIWLASRFLAGVASALVLVGVSAWAMPILIRHGREEWSGRVFAGVGTGIAFAGLFGLAAGIDAWTSRATWIALGLLSAALAVGLWRPLASTTPAASSPAQQARRVLPGRAIIAAACYMAFGYGYIIPATFLPTLARGYVDDPETFGLIWPVFGAAGALSTFAAARLGRGLAPWQLWTRAQWVLAVGVLLPALRVNVATLLLSAICVGGTFMIITMAGIKEALRLGGAPASLAVGVMTSAFAIGQILGPLTVSLLAASRDGFAVASLMAVVAMVAGNCVLLACSARWERLARLEGRPNEA